MQYRFLLTIMPMTGEGSLFLKEGRTTPKQMGNDKWQMTNNPYPYNQQPQGEPMSPFAPMFDATIA